MVAQFAYGIYWMLNRIVGSVRFFAFIRRTGKPRKVQIALLKRILRDNKDSQIGRYLRFGTMNDLNDFQAQVGMSTYEAIENELRSQENSGRQLLCEHQYTFLIHNASTTHHEGFPLTADAFRDLRRDIRISAYAWLRRYGLWRNHVFTILDDEPRSFSGTGLPQGLITGLVIQNLPGFMRRRCLRNIEIASISSFETRYFAYAIVALAETKVTGMLTANPAVLMHLLNVINARFDEICDAIETGNTPQEILSELPHMQLVRANQSRADELRTIFKTKEHISFSDFWRKLRGVICWTSGSCSASVRNLRTHLSPRSSIIEFGYQFGAAFGGINIDTKSNGCLLRFHRDLYEFAERGSWETGFCQPKLLDELIVGNEYYVMLTTRSGLYRFQTDQIVRVTGKVHRTPTFEYVQSGRSITNLNGEYIAESHVIEAVEKLVAEYGCDIHQYLMVSNADERKYDLYIETASNWDMSLVENWFDRALENNNASWAVKRMSERMQATRVHRVRNGTIDRLRAMSVQDGFVDPNYVLPHLNAHDATSIDMSELSEQ